MRPGYETLPDGVRAAVHAVLGWSVTSATTCGGGWSPGVASVVRGPGGAAFVKAGSSEVNALTPEMHRREAALTPLLPAELGGARLLGVVDEPPWFALVLTAVDGRAPAQPWVDAELDAALAALARVGAVRAPAGLPTAQEQLAGDLDRWHLLVGDGRLPAWERRHAAALAALEVPWREVVAGDGLVHLDVRADNLLLRPDGSAVLVDWPSAGRGDPLVDLLAFAPSVALSGGPGPAGLLARAGSVVDDRVTVLAVALAGLFRWRALQPPPAGMPSVRAFQAAQADVLADWLPVLTGLA